MYVYIVKKLHKKKLTFTETVSMDIPEGTSNTSLSFLLSFVCSFIINLVLLKKYYFCLGGQK